LWFETGKNWKSLEVSAELQQNDIVEHFLLKTTMEKDQDE